MKRANNILIVIIIFLTFVIIGLVTLLALTILNMKDKENKVEVKPVSTITNTKVLDMLDDVVSESGDVYYNLLNITNKTDEELFGIIITYLYSNNIYTKTGNMYYFKQSDIIECAKKYMMKDNFDYITKNVNYKYDSNRKTFSSDLIFMNTKPKALTLRSIEIYNKNESEIYVNYELEGTYTNNNSRISEKYNIVIDEKEMKIISTSKINKVK